MLKGMARQVTVVVAVAATIVVNLLAVFLPINDLTTKELADRFDVYFVPAGYVFAIWNLIYLGLIAYAVYQARGDRREDDLMDDIAGPFVLSSLGNIGWIFLWHYEQFTASLVAMAVLLLSLIVVYTRLSRARPPSSKARRWSVDAVFSLYLGWVSVATIANVTAVLDYVGWSGWGLSDVAWTNVMLAVGVALAFVMAWRELDWIFALVPVWAFVGIAVRDDGGPVTMAAYTAAACAFLAAAWAVRVRKQRLTARPAAQQ